jgi:hypothetical protein
MSAVACITRCHGGAFSRRAARDRDLRRGGHGAGLADCQRAISSRGYIELHFPPRVSVDLAIGRGGRGRRRGRRRGPVRGLGVGVPFGRSEQDEPEGRGHVRRFAQHAGRFPRKAGAPEIDRQVHVVTGRECATQRCTAALVEQPMCISLESTAAGRDGGRRSVTSVGVSVSSLAVSNNASPPTTARSIANKAMIRAFRRGAALSLDIEYFLGSRSDRCGAQRTTPTASSP